MLRDRLDSTSATPHLGRTGVIIPKDLDSSKWIFGLTDSMKELTHWRLRISKIRLGAVRRAGMKN